MVTTFLISNIKIYKFLFLDPDVPMTPYMDNLEEKERSQSSVIEQVPVSSW